MANYLDGTDGGKHNSDNCIASFSTKAEQDSLLEQAVINQLESDIEEIEFDAMSELIRQLILLEPARRCLLDYLSDEVKEEWLNGDMKITY